MTILIGIDPGLVKTGWGIIDVQGNSISYIACGTIKPKTSIPLTERLSFLHAELQQVIAEHKPTSAAIEETFVTANGQSTLKLGQARGALLLSLATANLPTSEYAARLVKKTITGVGNADKNQMGMMIRSLLPSSRDQLESAGEDAIDALAIAICHANHNSQLR